MANESVNSDADDADMVLLEECAGQMELALLKSLLEGEGIPYVAQGEHHSTMINGHYGAIAIMPRVLVAARDLERARELLSAKPTLQGNTEGSPLTDAVCPVHEKQALATCDRCGTFLCGDCGSLGQPPLCEDCVAIEAKNLRPALTPGEKRMRGMLGGVIPLLIVLAVGTVLGLARC